MKIYSLFPCAAVCWAGVTLAGAALLDANFTATLYTDDVEEVTGIAWAPDGSNRLFVTQQSGDIWIVKDGAGLPAAFATVTPLYRVDECGLLGICFDQNFVENGYVYAFATVSSSEQQ